MPELRPNDPILLHFTFYIPQGFEGTQGEVGPQGPQGETGEAGQVQYTDLEYAINTQSSNISNDVSTLGLYVNDPPTQWDVQQVVDKVDELINVLRR